MLILNGLIINNLPWTIFIEESSPLYRLADPVQFYPLNPDLTSEKKRDPTVKKKPDPAPPNKITL